MIKWILRYSFRPNEYIYQNALMECVHGILGAQEGQERGEMDPLIFYLKYFKPSVWRRLVKFLGSIQWEQN